MKSVITLLLTTLLVLLFISKPEVGYAVKSNTNELTTKKQPPNQETVLNKKELEKRLGRKLTLKEKILLPFAKKQLKKQARAKKNRINKKAKGKGKGKVQIVALLLCIFLGILGVHRFYLGYTGMGLLYLFTLGLVGVGWIIDIILLIIPNGLTPKGQTNYSGK